MALMLVCRKCDIPKDKCSCDPTVCYRCLVDFGQCTCPWSIIVSEGWTFGTITHEQLKKARVDNRQRLLTIGAIKDVAKMKREAMLVSP